MEDFIKKNLNKIIEGDCIKELKRFPENSIDLIFADPPYNLQLNKELYRPNQTKVDAVNDEWDKFSSFEEYDQFCFDWLRACHKILRKNGTIWVIGSYHNIFRIGRIMQDLGFWVLNDILWIKTNPMPNFRGTRFNNAHETLIWASKNQSSRFTFNYKSMKVFNDDRQMRSDWYIPICNGNERVKIRGRKAHSTQKPEALLNRIILSTSKTDAVVLDPFMGSGTTGAVAKRLGRNFIGIEKEKEYIKVANKRIKKVKPLKKEELFLAIEIANPRVPFGSLIESGLVKVGEFLYDKDKRNKAKVLASAVLKLDNETGSIHKISAKILKKPANNGWEFWYVMRRKKLKSLNDIRQNYINKFYKSTENRI